MYVGRDFSPADEGESEVYSLDFAKDCATGETLTSSTWTCAVAEDSPASDAAAADRVDGGASNSGTISSQRITGLVGGVKYLLQAFGVTNQGNRISLWSHVECVTPR